MIYEGWADDLDSWAASDYITGVRPAADLWALLGRFGVACHLAPARAG